ncbi:DUF6221 family protein [Streptomyces coelicoflavus]|uniref:DUF6221 family protein n=1 Tax=Streptomyces coelicoflavus TaxID=285562 RepID=UPI00324D2F53
MDELVQWLRAQLDNDDRTARAASSGWYGYNPTEQIAFVPPEDALHIATHSPARVLREIDAKRQIIDQFAYWNERAASEAVNPPKFPQPGLDLGLLLDAMNPVLRLLALPYADRSGYREAWRP